MAVNVTEKDKTLNEIIDWCADLANKLRNAPEGDFYANVNVNNVKADALTLVIRHCRHLLGYSGNMPTEVPNQSEDTKKSSVSEPLPHDMGLRVELDTNEAYYLKSGWKERCDGIYGFACGYVDCSEGVTWFKEPARIAIMYNHVKLAVPWKEPETETTKQSEDTK